MNHKKTFQESVEFLLTSGSPELDLDILKTVKEECKKSTERIQSVVEFLLKYIKKNSSQIRYSCIQLADVLFTRSHVFREGLLEDFPLFINFCVELHPYKIPGPKEWGKKFKILALMKLKEWWERYGQQYRKLDLAYKYLQEQGISFDTDAIHFQTTRAQQERQARTKSDAIKSSRYRKVCTDLEAISPSIKQLLIEMNNCFEILLPKIALENSFSQPNFSLNTDELIRNGLGTHHYRLPIELSKTADVIETKDNEVVFQELRRLYKVLVGKKLPLVMNWISVISCANIEGRDNELKKAIQLKMDIIDAKYKAEELGSSMYGPVVIPTDDSEDGEAFEEVDNGLNSSVNSTSIVKNEIELTPVPLISKFNNGQVNTLSSDSNIKSLQRRDEAFSSSFRLPVIKETDRESLLKHAPTIEYGDDLEYWDQSHVPLEGHGMESSHRFWKSNKDRDEISVDAINMRKRYVKIESEDIGIIDICGAPLKDGSLCPRRDIEKCPFHGTKIPRDAMGVPLEEALVSSTAYQPVASKKAAWELLEEDINTLLEADNILVKSKRRGLLPVVDDDQDKTKKRILKKSLKLSSRHRNSTADY